MIEVLPIKLLTDEDSMFFSNLNINLGKLKRLGIPVADGIVLTSPDIHLKTLLEHFNLSSKEVFEQTLTLIKKEVEKIPIPQVLKKEVGKNNNFLVNGEKVRSVKSLWLNLLNSWLSQVKSRLWREGFYDGLTQGLQDQVVIFIKKIEAKGSVYFDSLSDDSVIKIDFGKLHPKDSQKLDTLVREADKKLFMNYQYEWIVDKGIKLTKVLPFAPHSVILSEAKNLKINKPRDPSPAKPDQDDRGKSAVKIFADLSTGIIGGDDIDGIYIASEKIFDPGKPNEFFDDLAIKTTDLATTFSTKPVLFKLADRSEGMGKIRGSLRLLHQKSLFDPLLQALDFVRHKKGLTNVDIVIPFVRGVNELMQMKRELSTKKLMRKNSLKLYLELANPENIINLEDYLQTGIDGVVLNMDEMVAHINGFDHIEEELGFYKNEINGLFKFIGGGIKLLHKLKIPILVSGTICLKHEVLEFLVESGVFAIVVQRYEASSAKDILKEAEKRLISKKSI